MRKFYLDKGNAKLMGVFAGLSRSTGINANWLRIGAVVLTLVGGFPWTVLAYGLAGWLASPRRAERSADRWTSRVDLAAYEAPPRASVRDLQASTRDIDQRLAEVDRYVTTSNHSLEREIEQLR